MSDISSGPPASSTDRAKQVAREGKGAAVQAAGDVKDTAKEQVQRVAGEATAQARSLAGQARDRMSEQARSQNDKLVSTIRQTADQLDEMRGDRDGSPAATVVSRVADSGRQLADYLDRNGPEGVLQEVQDFARRRPGAFLAAALAAGFVVGRLGKGVAKADPDAGQAKPATDEFVSPAPGYPTGTAAGYPTGSGTSDYPATAPATTGYPAPVETTYAATGTGAPLAVSEEPLLPPGGAR
jgi:uncharacterized protein YjbJ (UPF0337 family)